jgi:hypothetical protein
MAVMAQWQGKTWEVSQKRVVTLSGLVTTYAVKTENSADASGQSATRVTGMALQGLSFETVLSDSLGVNVESELVSWKALVGQSGPFLLAGKRFGPERFLLSSVEVGDVALSDMGRIHIAKLSLSFVEDAQEAAKDKPAVKSSTSKQAASKQKKTPAIITNASTYRELGITSAVGVGAKANDKTDKKPNNPQMQGAKVMKK